MALWIVAATAIMSPSVCATRAAKAPLLRRLRPAFLGMCIAHLGFAVTIIGHHRRQRLGPADRPAHGAGRQLRVRAATPSASATWRKVQGPNYRADRGHVEVLRDGEAVAMLTPEKRIYPAQPQPMTEASIDASLARDVFVALGEPLGDGAWAVRVQVKPLIRLIWLGPLIMALGGLLAVPDRRYRMRVRRCPGRRRAPTRTPDADTRRSAHEPRAAAFRPRAPRRCWCSWCWRAVHGARAAVFEPRDFASPSRRGALQGHDRRSCAAWCVRTRTSPTPTRRLPRTCAGRCFACIDEGSSDARDRRLHGDALRRLRALPATVQGGDPGPVGRAGPAGRCSAWWCCGEPCAGATARHRRP